MTNFSNVARGSHGACDGATIAPLMFPDTAKVQHETVLWSNFLVNAPVVYSLLERRMLYYLTLYVKHRFTEKNLGVPDNWKDLYFQMTDADLGKIGGRTNVLQTYEALTEIGKKFITVAFTNDKGENIRGKVHWVDSFFYNADTGKYEVRMSPEVMPYLINLSKSFTAFDAGTAMMVSSKFGQKFYELCCQFSGDFRYTDKDGNRYKKNVVPISIADFRRIFNLEEVKDARTRKVVKKAQYTNFNDIKRRVIEPSLKELHELYYTGHSNVWFDYLEEKTGRKVTMIYLFVYSKKNPKSGLPRPWQAGDEPLSPYEREYIEAPSPKEKIATSTWKDCNEEQLAVLVEMILNKYLRKQETWHYLNYIRNINYNRRDCYLQVIQVIKEKEQQPKFSKGTAAYKRKSIMQYALQENLKEYGWNIPAPTTARRLSSYTTSVHQ